MADQAPQMSAGLVQGLGRALAFALLAAFFAQLGPVDPGQLHVVGDPDLGDGHPFQAGVVQIRSQGRSDHALDDSGYTGGAGVDFSHY